MANITHDPAICRHDIEKPQIGGYFFVDITEPALRITEVFERKVNAWFVKAEDGSRYLVLYDHSESIWFCLMKIEHGNF